MSDGWKGPRIFGPGENDYGRRHQRTPPGGRTHRRHPGRGRMKKVLKVLPGPVLFVGFALLVGKTFDEHALAVLVYLWLWFAAGHLVCALGRWGYPEELGWTDIAFWPNRLWFTVCNLLHDWRTDLYYRTKHL